MTVLSWMGEHWFLSLVFGSFAFALLHSLVSGFYRVLMALVNRGRPEPEEPEETETGAVIRVVDTSGRDPEEGEQEQDAQPKPVKRRSLWERLNDDS